MSCLPDLDEKDLVHSTQVAIMDRLTDAMVVAVRFKQWDDLEALALFGKRVILLLDETSHEFKNTVSTKLEGLIAHAREAQRFTGKGS